VTGIDTKWAGNNHIHHNVVKDRGSEVADRMADLCGIDSAPSIHHNLLKRVRQGGINGQNGSQVYSNEIYVDSCATNAFGVGYYAVAGAECRDNKIFGTGYLVNAIGTVSAGVSDVMVHDNFIHLQATEPDARWSEYGSQSGAYCCRITWGGDNIQYYDNVMVTYGRDGGMVRGTWFYMQPDIVDCVYRNNVVKAVLQNMASDIQGCIVHCGDSDPNDGVLVYENNLVISNFCNVRLGEDYYGCGCNARFYDNTFVKVGPDRADYRTIGIGYNSRSTGHEFYDSLFEGGASYSSYRFDGTSLRDFSVGWTLTVQTEPYADVAVTDSASTVVYTGQADNNGIANALLLEYKRQPTAVTYYTPHQVTASLGGNSRTVSVTLDAKKTVEVYLHDMYALTVNSGTGDGTYDAGTVVAIAADAPASGTVFDAWTGDTAGIADQHASSTTITMPASATVVTATYKLSGYSLTVNSGSGSGTYSTGTVVAIVANAPVTAGAKFLKWTGNTATVANANASSTTITMPASATAVTATYTWKGDLNGDRFVGQGDLNIVLAQWGKSGGQITDPRADPSGDNFVGQADLNIVLADWGKSAASW